MSISSITRQQTLITAYFRQRYFYFVAAARRFFHHLPEHAFHAFDNNILIACRQYQFEFIADRKLVFNINSRKTGCLIIISDFTAKLLLMAFGITGDIVLLLMGMVALIKTVGLTAIGEVLQHAEQFRLKCTPRQRIINRLTIGLCGTCHIIMRLGAAFDLKAVYADFDQTLHMLDGP